MKSIKCRRIQRAIWSYSAGELSLRSAHKVGRHLATCVECREVSDLLTLHSSLLSEACPTPEFDEDFFAGIRAATLSTIARNRDRLTPIRFPRRWAYSAACALVFACIGLVI